MSLTVTIVRRKVMFKQLATKLLIESRGEDLQEKYPNLDVQEISENDPSSTKKYLSWMCKQLSLGASKNDLYPTIKSFDKNLARIQNKDINSYKTTKELEDVIKSLPEKSKTKQKEEIKGKAPKIYEDDKCLIVRPDDKNSCMVYGSGTKWCITMKDASYYEQYTSENVVFYYVLSKILDEKNPLSKIAIAIMRNDNNEISDTEIYDAEDNQIKNISRKLLDICKKDAVTRPQSVLSKIKSEKATEQELIDASKSDSSDVRQLIAGNTSTPKEILDLLSRDEDSQVRCCIAENPSTPKEILIVLSRDEVSQVRSGVAFNPNTPKKVLIVLSRDKNQLVRSDVAENPSTPKEVLDFLSRDTNIKNESLIREYVKIIREEIKSRQKTA